MSGQFANAVLEARFRADYEVNFTRRDRYVVVLILVLEVILIGVDLVVLGDTPNVGRLRMLVRLLYMASLLVILFRIFARTPLSGPAHVFLIVSMLIHNGIIATYHHPDLALQLPTGFLLAVYVFTITAYYTFLTPRLTSILFVTVCLGCQHVVLESWPLANPAGAAYAPFLLFGLIAFSHYTAVSLARQHRRVWLGAEQAKALQHRAEEVQEFRARLLELIGHDLRQPLGALGYYLAALRIEAGRLDVVKAGSLNKIAGQIDTVNREVGEMLDKALEMAQLDNDAVMARCRCQTVAPLLGELTERFSGLAARQGIVLRCRGSRHILAHDPALMSAVLRNLVGNALKYHDRSATRPRVVVAVRNGATPCIDICDNGGGFPGELLAHIAGGRRASGATAAGGHGLGLAIARQFSLKQGWQMDIATRPGHGTHIRMTYPHTPQAEALRRESGLANGLHFGKVSSC